MRMRVGVVVGEEAIVVVVVGLWGDLGRGWTMRGLWDGRGRRVRSCCLVVVCDGRGAFGVRS